MITTNIWLVFSFYLVYVIISIPLFFMTSGGWMSIFFYIAFTGLFYIATTIFLFFSATARTAKRRMKVKIKGNFLIRIIALQTFVILFNYGTCGDNICYQGFLPSLLEETNFPVIFTPPFVVVLFALLLYLGFLSMFLLDVA
ncbi:hypothetical protein [Coleofasciculus sp. G2-EDA-02]|uniref:hypothetical protein n=1 Tax=unclassified Coleofasciculus TaxID=2692782 RepID=UPI0033033D52